MIRYCGRNFTPDEMERIRCLVQENPSHTRAQLSRLTCEILRWHKRDGGLKEMSCRVAMLRMQDDGLITLPPPRQKNNPHSVPAITSRSDPFFPITKAAGQLSDLRLLAVERKTQSSFWNELIQRYHYLGYKRLPGAQLRYFVQCREGTVAVIGFGAAAWKVAPRDNWIGWTPQQRERNLHLIVNNARFLILPWVQSKNLASKILSMVTKQLPLDWEQRYGYRPVLLETFVQKDRFEGTSYKAANWIFLGETQGRGKLDRFRTYSLPKKSIFVYPLLTNFQTALLC